MKGRFICCHESNISISRNISLMIGQNSCPRGENMTISRDLVWIIHIQELLRKEQYIHTYNRPHLDQVTPHLVFCSESRPPVTYTNQQRPRKGRRRARGSSVRRSSVRAIVEGMRIDQGRLGVKWVNMCWLATRSNHHDAICSLSLGIHKSPPPRPPLSLKSQPDIKHLKQPNPQTLKTNKTYP